MKNRNFACLHQDSHGKLYQWKKILPCHGKKGEKLTKKNLKQVFDNLETWSNFEGKVASPKLPNVSEYKILTFVILHKKACQF